MGGRVGPLEILSREAVKDYYDLGREACAPELLQGMPTYQTFNAEDSWISACVARIGVNASKQFGILNDPWCSGAPFNDVCATDKAAVAFHHYKEIDQYSQCMLKVASTPWAASPEMLAGQGLVVGTPLWG